MLALTNVTEVCKHLIIFLLEFYLLQFATRARVYGCSAICVACLPFLCTPVIHCWAYERGTVLSLSCDTDEENQQRWHWTLYRWIMFDSIEQCNSKTHPASSQKWCTLSYHNNICADGRLDISMRHGWTILLTAAILARASPATKPNTF